MLVANLCDGQTIRFDLYTDKGLSDWQSFVSDSNGRITALAISHNKNLYTFPRPIKNVSDFGADVLRDRKTGRITAERIWCHCGKVRVTLTVYVGQTPVSKVDVRPIGEVRFKPGG